MPPELGAVGVKDGAVGVNDGIGTCGERVPKETAETPEPGRIGFDVCGYRE